MPSSQASQVFSTFLPVESTFTDIPRLSLRHPACFTNLCIGFAVLSIDCIVHHGFIVLRRFPTSSVTTVIQGCLLSSLYDILGRQVLPPSLHTTVSPDCWQCVLIVTDNPHTYIQLSSGVFSLRRFEDQLMRGEEGTSRSLTLRCCMLRMKLAKLIPFFSRHAIFGEKNRK